MKSLKSKLSLFSLCMISGYSAVSMANEISNKTETQQVDDMIIVVGERVGRSEVETGSSVNIITNKDLERRPDLHSLTQVLKETPNIIDIGLGN